MRRWIAVLWHASCFLLAAALFFFFVLPRWNELTGAWPVGLGSAMRITCGALLGLAALPVVFTLMRTRRPEFGTPQLALSLRFWSIVLHVLAGALVAGAAISEIWVSLNSSGQTLFGIYGSAAAVAILGALTFYLAFAAELPPPPPKPLRPKGRTRRQGRKSETDEDVDEVAETNEESATSVPDESVGDAVEETPAEAAETPATVETEEVTTSVAGNAEDASADEPGSRLRNRRPDGKSTSRRFGRSRRGVALED